MSTDVSGITGAIGQSRTAAAHNGTNGPASRPSKPAEPRSDDTVELHSTTRARALAQSVEDVPVVDGKRVQAVREAIASGNFQMDPNRIAEKLIALETEVHPADA